MSLTKIVGNPQYSDFQIACLGMGNLWFTCCPNFKDSARYGLLNNHKPETRLAQKHFVPINVHDKFIVERIAPRLRNIHNFCDEWIHKNVFFLELHRNRVFSALLFTTTEKEENYAVVLSGENLEGKIETDIITQIHNNKDVSGFYPIETFHKFVKMNQAERKTLLELMFTSKDGAELAYQIIHD